MQKLLLTYGRYIQAFALLIILNEFVWQHHEAYTATEWILAVVGYLMLSVLAIDLETRFHVKSYQSALLIAGIVGVTQSLAITGNLTTNRPTDLVVFGTGLATINYFAIYLLLNKDLLVKSGAILVTMFAGGIWTFGIGPDFDADHFTNDINILVYAPLAAILTAFAFSLNRYYKPDFMAKPDFRITLGLSVGLVLLTIIQFALENVSVMALVVGIMVIVVIIVMLWFRYMNFGTNKQQPQTAEDDIVKTSIIIIGVTLIGSIGGYALQDSGSILAVIIVIFGLGWLPFLSGLLGLRAFETLTDSDELL